ncbi:MAG: ABC transporter ATP-binding protein [Desulfobacula sp.]|nr:ABC transporter ATP-binding protein [Desulfobacula sp.]
MNNEPLLEVKHIKKYFTLNGGKGVVKAVDDVSFCVQRGETFGIVGESGCGKSTLGRVILRLIEPTDGRIFVEGNPICDLSSRELRKKRKKMQMIFQDAMASLDSRQKIGNIIAEPLVVHGVATKKQRRKIVENLLLKVGLGPDAMERYPHEFSGGQRQRICIARAISLNPQLIIADEPVSALDVSIQSQVLNLLVDLREELSLSYIFISHDLAVVEHICSKIAVMYLGQIVEMAETKELFENPVHPYTRTLLSAIPIPDPTKRGKKRIILQGDIPSPSDVPSGCRFQTRCPDVQDRCRHQMPDGFEKETPGGRHFTKCHQGFGDQIR